MMGLSPRALFFSLCLAGLVMSRSLLVTATKSGAGYQYDPTSVVLLTEFLKLGFAFALNAWERRSQGKRGWFSMADVDTRVAVLYAVPSILYAIQNNLVFFALLYLAPPTFELFANLKIVTTALASWLVLKKRLNAIQWVAVVLLFLGTILGQLPKEGAVQATNDDPGLSAEMFGFMLCLLYAGLSALAGIFTEKLLKESKQPTHLQNMEIYMWSVLVNVWYAWHNGKSVFTSSLFDGYDFMTWLVVINGALMGQCVSFVMKYADNVVKVFAAALAMFMSTILSILFFSFQPSALLLIGFVISSISLFLYLGPHNQQLLEHEKNMAREKSKTEMTAV